MEKLKIFLISFGFILAIALIIPFLFYLVNFWGSPLSQNPQIWGTFGDYFGGIFNPILALANLVIFIKLTIIVTRIQDDSTTKSLIHQRRILVSELMHDSLKDISKTLNTLGQEIVANKDESKWEIIKVRQSVLTFSNNYTHLFDEIQSNELQQSLNDVLTANSAQPYVQQNFSNAFEKYLETKDQFIQSLHERVMEKLID